MFLICFFYLRSNGIPHCVTSSDKNAMKHVMEPHLLKPFFSKTATTQDVDVQAAFRFFREMEKDNLNSLTVDEEGIQKGKGQQGKGGKGKGKGQQGKGGKGKGKGQVKIYNFFPSNTVLSSASGRRKFDLTKFQQIPLKNKNNAMINYMPNGNTYKEYVSNKKFEFVQFKWTPEKDQNGKVLLDHNGRELGQFSATPSQGKIIIGVEETMQGNKEVTHLVPDGNQEAAMRGNQPLNTIYGDQRYPYVLSGQKDPNYPHIEQKGKGRTN